MISLGFFPIVACSLYHLVRPHLNLVNTTLIFLCPLCKYVHVFTIILRYFSIISFLDFLYFCKLVRVGRVSFLILTETKSLVLLWRFIHPGYIDTNKGFKRYLNVKIAVESFRPLLWSCSLQLWCADCSGTWS